jgi:hypothetical protein
MAEKKKRTATKLRPVEGQVHQFAVLGEMTGLLQRVRGNKSKRTASSLLKTGPFRVSVVALDEGGQLEDHAVDGPSQSNAFSDVFCFPLAGANSVSQPVTCWSPTPESLTISGPT